MPASAPTVFYHADDYGITAAQARAILDLSAACGGAGALNSVSIFANSPAFDEAAALARPFVEQGKLKLGLHLNLVEGWPVSRPDDAASLLNDRATFGLDFLGLLRKSHGPHHAELRVALVNECRAQIARFLEAFPEMHDHLRLDSHQHTHAIPLVFEALSIALVEEGCTVEHLRAPIEPLSPHRAAVALRRQDPHLTCPKSGNQAHGTAPEERPRITAANRAKVALLDYLWKRCDHRLIKVAEPAPVFCGVALSAHMGQMDPALVRAFSDEAAARGRDLEILFHPITVPAGECLDPDSHAFTAACASPERDEEARALVALGAEEQSAR